MNVLTPSFEPDAGLLILEGGPAGMAGEAGFTLAAGTDLAFDRFDGHLVRVVTGTEREPAAAPLLDRLFGERAISALREASASLAAPTALRPLTPEPVLSAALSSLARLNAFRDTSPVPRQSRWWTVESAILAEQAGLHARALAEMDLLRDRLALSEPAQSCDPPLDVAAEVADLGKATVRRSQLQWVVDPALIPAGLFRFGLSPHSDLRVRQGSDMRQLVIEATLAPGARTASVGQYAVRLVNPAERSVRTQAPLQVYGSRARSQIRLPVPMDEVGGLWVELVGEPGRPVSSLTHHLIRRALRWADAALRAARAPKGLAPRATAADLRRWPTSPGGGPQRLGGGSRLPARGGADCGNHESAGSRPGLLGRGTERLRPASSGGLDDDNHPAVAAGVTRGHGIAGPVTHDDQR